MKEISNKCLRHVDSFRIGPEVISAVQLFSRIANLSPQPEIGDVVDKVDKRNGTTDGEWKYGLASGLSFTALNRT